MVKSPRERPFGGGMGGSVGAKPVSKPVLECVLGDRRGENDSASEEGAAVNPFTLDLSR